MWLRKVLMVAAVAAPLVWSPMDASAQARGQDGQDRAAAAQATDQGRTDAPAGLANAFAGRTAPDALVNRFPGLAPQPEPVVEPAPEAEPEPEPEPCSPTMEEDPDGSLWVVGCDGERYPV